MINDSRLTRDFYAESLAQRGKRLLISMVGILLLSYTISMIVMRLSPPYAILAGGAVIAALVLSMKFELGLLFYVLICALQPSGEQGMRGATMNVGFGIVPLAILGVLCLFWLVAKTFRDEPKVEKTRLSPASLWFFIVAGASVAATLVIWNQNVRANQFGLLVNFAEVMLWVLCVAAFYVTANCTTNKKWLTAIFWLVVILASYFSVFQMAGRMQPLAMPRGTFIVAYAAILCVARVIFGTESRAAKTGYAFLALLFLANTVWDPTWVSGWLAAGLGAGFVILFYSRKIFVVATIIVLFAMLVYPGFIHSIYDQSRQEGDMDRANLWTDAVRMAVASNPMLGVGPGNYRTYNREFSSIWYGNRTYTTAHSDFAQMIGEIGLFGIVMFLWLIVAGIRTGVDSAKRSASNTKWLSIGATAIFASIAVTSLVGDYLLPSRINGGIATFGTSVLPWILLGAAVAVSRRNVDEAEEAA